MRRKLLASRYCNSGDYDVDNQTKTLSCINQRYWELDLKILLPIFKTCGISSI